MKTTFPKTFSTLIFLSVVATFPLIPAVSDPPADSSKVYKTDSTWPGIDFRIISVQRTVQNHLMVILQVEAGAKASPDGTLVGSLPVIPPGTKIKDYYRFNPSPYILTGSTMTDELSGITYPMVPPVAPLGRGFFHDYTTAILRPRQGVTLSLQFMVPPPPPPPSAGTPPAKQTLSFLFPKALGAISHVPLPSLEDPVEDSR